MLSATAVVWASISPAARYKLLWDVGMPDSLAVWYADLRWEELPETIHKKLTAEREQQISNPQPGQGS